MGFPGGAVVKNPPANAGDTRDSGSIPGSGKSSRGESGNPLQYSCRENSVDSEPWWATAQGSPELDTSEQVGTSTVPEDLVVHVASSNLCL